SLDRLVAAGRLGAKSRAGFYRHPGGRGAKPAFDESVLAMLRGDGTTARSTPTGDELMDLMILPIVNEAAQCLVDGIVRSARDVDLAMVMGTGFPPFRGGPLRYADSLGSAEICRRLESLAARFGSRLAPVPNLREMAAAGRRFHS
ncbi:MAG: 3-hydroxyacyl-CoA dehydrogenase family protein, partial [Vicinamibacteria bacterium]